MLHIRPSFFTILSTSAHSVLECDIDVNPYTERPEIFNPMHEWIGSQSAHMGKPGSLPKNYRNL